MKRAILAIGICLMGAHGVAAAQNGAAVASPTVVKDQAARTKLLGRHMLSLQWISWDNFGSAAVTDSKGVLLLKGEQTGRD